MGSVAFRLPDGLTPAEAQAAAAATLAGGYDLTPVPTRAALDPDGHTLTLTRDAAESGSVCVAWPGLTADGADLVCVTGTLRERADPYHLAVELARGKLNQVRTQVADWQTIGFDLPPAAREHLAAATRRFGAAVLDPAGRHAGAAARDALAHAAALADTVSAAFAEQLLETRLADGGPLETRLGCRLAALPPPDQRAAFLATFTSARLVPNWRAVEADESKYDWAAFDALVGWAVGAGLDVSVGPVIDLADGSFPDWVRPWAGDLPSLAAFFCDFVEAVVRRYADRVRAWQICAGFNHADRFGLVEDDRLRLAARLLDAARQADPDASVVLNIAQPWGDYLAADDHTYSPLVFADTLIRAGFSFAAVELEVLTGRPAGSDRAAPARDAVAVYRLIDLFERLAIPLEATFGRPLTGPVAAAAAQTHTAVALALPQVRAVYWDGWGPAEAGRLEGAGVGGPSPAAVRLRKQLAQWRQRYLA